MQSRQTTLTIAHPSTNLELSSCFDSGNMESAYLSSSRLHILPALDPMHPLYSTRPSSKTFFHFSIRAHKNATIDIAIERMKILEYFQGAQNNYRLVICRRKLKQRWSKQKVYEKCQIPVKIICKDGAYELHFQLELVPAEEVFLAYHFPYSYETLQSLLDSISSMKPSAVYFKRELLIQSLEGRRVQLITMTADAQGDGEEPRISKGLFPYFQMQGRAKKFNKPYILLTCRVHPGQTSASFALEGILKYLLSQTAEAQLLLELFVFVIVPMVNPDGVYHGTYRMDTLGHNLNRFYSNAVSHKHPSIFAIQTMLSSLQGRLVFFMDLHSHPHAEKGSFIYGNSLNTIQEQIETQLFAKILERNSQCFGYHWSSFAKEQMNSKDANETLGKDGSARVQVWKSLAVNCCYTMEMGYHGAPIKEEKSESMFATKYRRTNNIFQIQDYKSHGVAILLSILELFISLAVDLRLNPKKPFLQQLREQICKELIEKQERFRLMDAALWKKLKNIQTILTERSDDLFKKFVGIDKLIVNWIVRNNNILQKIGQQQQKQDKLEKQKSSKQKQITKSSLKKKYASVDLDSYMQNILIDHQKNSNETKNFESVRQLRSIRIKENSKDHSIRIKGVQSLSAAKQPNCARLLNLNFNPFAAIERRRVSSITENNKKLHQKINPFIQMGDNPLTQQDLMDIRGMNQIQMMQSLRKSYDKSIDPFSKVMNGFHVRQIRQTEESFDQKYVRKTEQKDEQDNTNANKFQSIENAHRDFNPNDKLILPRIFIPRGTRIEGSPRKEQPFDVELRFRQEYKDKYKIEEIKELKLVQLMGNMKVKKVRHHNINRLGL